MTTNQAFVATLSNGDTVTIPVITTATTATGNYTVGFGDTTTNLQVASIDTVGLTVTDADANTQSDFGLPASNLPTGINISVDKAVFLAADCAAGAEKCTAVVGSCATGTACDATIGP